MQDLCKTLHSYPHLDGARLFVSLVKCNVHADHVLRLVEGELDVTRTVAQLFAAGPSRLGIKTSVPRKARLTALLSAAARVRRFLVVGVGRYGYGGFGGCVFLKAWIYLNCVTRNKRSENRRLDSGIAT